MRAVLEPHLHVRWQQLHRRVDEACDGPVGPRFSRAYLHHLCRQKEPLYTALASMHNLLEMAALTADLRQAIWRDEV